MSGNSSRTPSAEQSSIMASLRANLESIRAIVRHFHKSPAYQLLSEFADAITVFSRREFLNRLQAFFERRLRVEARIVCSVGAGIEDSRQARLRGASCDTRESDEHLIINLYSASSSGNIIPLVIFAGDGVEIEGIMNVAPAPGAEPDAVRDEFLHACAQIIALAFRNLKLAAGIEEVPDNPQTLGRRSAKPSGGRFRRILRFITLRASICMFAIFVVSGTASYAGIEPLNQPFNAAAAALGKWVFGIPYQAGKTALDDGLLHVMIKSQSRQRTHDWLKGGNPSGIDYEQALRDNGWQDPCLHRLGRMPGMAP